MATAFAWEGAANPESTVHATRSDILVGQKGGANEVHSEAANETKSKLQNEETRPVKRRRKAYVETSGPSVQVTYENLSRDSKTKLAELLQYWAQWHAQSQPVTDVGTESGTVIYFPPDGSPNSLFWIDKPRITQGTSVSAEPSALFKEFNLQYEQDSAVPQYERGTHAPIDSEKGGGEEGVYLRVEKEAPRCWNCASYTHSAKDCPKPRDQQAFNAARDEFNAKRGVRPGETTQRRYFEGGKYDDLKPGQLTTPLREALGIQLDDPPPWLQRMRELGYPPAYLGGEDGSDSPSGIQIFGTDEGDGFELSAAPLDETADIDKGHKMLVAFPGINASIPPGADPQKWEDRRTTKQAFGEWLEVDRGGVADSVSNDQSMSISNGNEGTVFWQDEGISMHSWRLQGGHVKGQKIGGVSDGVRGVSDVVIGVLDGVRGVSDGFEGVSNGVMGVFDGVRGVFDANQGGIDRDRGVADGLRNGTDGSGGRKRKSRWDSRGEYAEAGRTWPGLSSLAGVVKPHGGWESGSRAGGWSEAAAMEGDVFRNGGVNHGENGSEDFPPGYENAQQWRSSSEHRVESAAQFSKQASYEHTPSQPPLPSHTPSPPPPPSYTPPPPPPPSDGTPNLPPGYEANRTVTPPPYNTYYEAYSASQVTLASQVNPESYYTPQQQCPPDLQQYWQAHDQPQPSGQAVRGQAQMWGGFWQQYNQ